MHVQLKLKNKNTRNRYCTDGKKLLSARQVQFL